MEKYTIIKDLAKKVRRFNLEGHTLEFKLKPVPEDVEPVGWIREGIKQVIARGTEGLQPGDKVGFSFCSKDFKRGEGWVAFRPVEEVTYDDVWNVISNVYQSNSAGLNTETFCLGVTSMKMPTERGKDRSRRYNTLDEECDMQQGIAYHISNQDNLYPSYTLDRESIQKKHVFDKLPGSARVGRKYCRGCYKKKLKNEIPKNKVKKVSSFCKNCPGQPRYCLECFNISHYK